MLHAGQLIKDGDSVWIVDDARDGFRPGDIILRPTLHEGFIKANGAQVKASDYPRLIRFVVDNNLIVSQSDRDSNLAKYVYDEGSDMLILPNLVDRLLQGGEKSRVSMQDCLT